MLLIMKVKSCDNVLLLILILRVRIRKSELRNFHFQLAPRFTLYTLTSSFPWNGQLGVNINRSDNSYISIFPYFHFVNDLLMICWRTARRRNRSSLRLRHHVARELGGDGRDVEVDLQDGRGLFGKVNFVLEKIVEIDLYFHPLFVYLCLVFQLSGHCHFYIFLKVWNYKND